MWPCPRPLVFKTRFYQLNQIRPIYIMILIIITIITTAWWSLVSDETFFEWKRDKAHQLGGNIINLTSSNLQKVKTEKERNNVIIINFLNWFFFFRIQRSIHTIIYNKMSNTYNIFHGKYFFFITWVLKFLLEQVVDVDGIALDPVSVKDVELKFE